MALVNAVAGGVDGEAAACDLTPMEFAVVRLFPIDMEWTVTELAQMLSVDASSMSRVVNKLVERGLLRRRRPREDRRLVFLELTKDGVALGLELQEKAHACEERLTRGISPVDLEVFLPRSEGSWRITPPARSPTQTRTGNPDKLLLTTINRPNSGHQDCASVASCTVN